MDVHLEPLDFLLKRITLLRSRERSSDLNNAEKCEFYVSFYGQQFGSPKKILQGRMTSCPGPSMVWTFECLGSLLWTVAVKLFI